MDRFASVTDQQLAINRETPDDPFDSSDGSLALAIIAACDRGLQDAETDDGVWAGIDGTERPLPRRVRAPIMMRAKFSWRAARNMWRST